MVDGLHAVTSANANTLAARDGSGYLHAQYFNQWSGNSENPTISQFMVTNGDNYFRKASLAHVKSTLGITGIVNNSLNSNNISNSGTYTAAVASDGCTLIGTTNAAIAAYNSTINSSASRSSFISNALGTISHDGVTIIGGLYGRSKMGNSIIHPGYYDVNTTVNGSQSEQMMMYCATTNATPTAFYVNATEYIIPIASGETIMMTAQIAGMQNGSPNNAAGYILECTYKNVSGTISVVGTTVLNAQENNTAWNITVTTTTNGLILNAVGVASTNISWAAKVSVVRLRG
jgi:hypothetical protein